MSSTVAVSPVAPRQEPLRTGIIRLLLSRRTPLVAALAVALSLAPSAATRKIQSRPLTAGLVASQVCDPSTTHCPEPVVTAAASALSMSLGSGTVSFTVTNIGDITGTFALSAFCAPPLTSCSPSTTSSSFGAGQSRTITVTFQANTAGTGTVTLVADYQGGTSTSQASTTVTVNNPLVVDVSPHSGANRDVSQCIADCFEAVYTYSTPPYVSMDAPRSLGLIYRSGRVWPVGTVIVDARDTTSKTVSKLSIQLKTAAGALVTQFGGRQEVFYSYQPGVNNRLEAQFDASGLSTGAYPYTAIVTVYYTDNTSRTGTVAVNVLVDNAATSPYGSGWAVVGLQRLYPQTGGGVLITEGEGSIRYYAGTCAAAPCSFQQTPGDFSVVSRHSWADGTTYDRRYPDGTIVAFKSNGLAAYTKDRFGNTTTYVYDASNRLTSETDPAGQSVTLAYAGPSGSLSRITDPAGRASLINQPAGTRIISIQDPAGGLTFNSAVYDTHGRLTGWSDRRGGLWNETYDCMRRADSTLMPTVTVMVGSAMQPVRPVSRRAAPDQQVGLCETSSLGSSTNPLSAATSANVRASTTNTRGFVTRYAVDAFLAPTRIEEPLGRTTTITRNGSAQPTVVRAPNGHVLTMVWSGPDLLDTYDSAAAIHTLVDREATFHEITTAFNAGIRDSNYWSAGKLDSTVSIAGALRRRWKLTYETIGGRITGRLASATDPRGHVTTYAYSASGLRNLASVTSAGRITTYAYDTYGRQTSVTAGTGDTSRASYDLLNRQTLLVGPQRDSTLWSYDSLFVTMVRDAMGGTHLLARNALGWIERSTDPNNRDEVMSYDAAGNLLQRVNRRGQIIAFTYDSLGNVRTRTADGVTTTFALDPLGRFVAASNNESVDTTKYDVLGNPTLERTVRNGVVYDRSSTFNAFGLRTALTIAPWQSNRAYHFAASFDLDTLTDGAGQKTAITYDAEGETTGIQLPTSPALSVARDYPGTHAPSQITYSNPSVNATIGAYYSYGSNGLIDRRLQTMPAASEAGRAYNYDPSRRVTGYYDYTSTSNLYGCEPGTAYLVDPVTGQSCWSEGTTTYTAMSNYQYDLLGNRSDSGSVVQTGSRLLRFRGDTMMYDADGNLNKRVSLTSGRSDSLTWNSIGQLVAVTRDGVTTAFGYDGFGRRVRKSTGTTTIRYLHDGDNLLSELDSAGVRIAEYTYYPGIDRPHSVQHWAGGIATTYYFATDFPGSVVALLDGTGAIVNRYSYAPFGTRQDSSGTVPNPLRFGGREYDTETDLYYNRARYYDSKLGRFLSEDPMGIAGGMNPYTYASNTPINDTDPFGYCPAGTELVISVDEQGHWRAECVSSGGTLPEVRTVAQPWPSNWGPRESGESKNFGQRCCSTVSPMSSTGPNPYRFDQLYFGTPAREMFTNGGDNKWGQIVRSCLVCELSGGVGMADAHHFCYQSATERTGLAQTVQGYARAIAAAAAIDFTFGATVTRSLTPASDISTIGARWRH